MSYVTPKKNTEFIFYVSLISQANTKIMQANPTLAAGDFQVSTDDGAPSNLDTIPVVDADFTKRVKVTLSADEMNGDNITLIASDAAGDEWCDLTVNIQTTATQIDGLAPAGEYDTEMSRIDVDVSSRSTLTAAGVWDALLTGITTAASVGKLIKDYLDAAVSGRAPASEYDTEMARIDVAVSTRTKPADTQAKVTLVDTVTENTDMRGTDDGALATVCTEARLAELDAANLPADADSIKAVTDKVDNMIEAVE